MKEVSNELAAKIINDVLEERCASPEGLRRYRPMLEERADRIVERLIAEPDKNDAENNQSLHDTLALLNLADSVVADELGSGRYPKPACPADGGCAMCCTHMRVVFSAQEAAVIAGALLGLSEPERATIAKRLPPIGLSGPGSQCGLLNDQGLCTLYEARPINCRTYRSCSITACEDRVRWGRNAGEEVVFAYPFDDLVRKSFHHTLRSSGTPQPLEMNSFLALVLQDDKQLAAWAAGEAQTENAE